jgi:hypothetical protein
VRDSTTEHNMIACVCVCHDSTTLPASIDTCCIADTPDPTRHLFLHYSNVPSTVAVASMGADVSVILLFLLLILESVVVVVVVVVVKQ